MSATGSRAPLCWRCMHLLCSNRVIALLLTSPVLSACSMGGGVAALLSLQLRYMFSGATWHSSCTYCWWPHACSRTSQ
jgi:hypothetical protein